MIDQASHNSRDLIFGQMLEHLVAGFLPDSVASGIGQLPFVLALPPLSVGVFSAFRAVERGQPVMPGYLFANIGRNLPRLCVLGALYYAATLVALGLISLTDGGLLYDVMRNMSKLEDKQLDVAMLNRSALLLLPLSLALTAANWFAPLLTGWPMTTSRYTWLGTGRSCRWGTPGSSMCCCRPIRSQVTCAAGRSRAPI